MADLHNPLFEDEKEFLERQKLEYERALLGDVQNIKDKTLEVGKYAAIGAGILGGIWLLSKAFGGKKSTSRNQQALKSAKKREARQLKGRTRQPLASTNVDTAVADDLGFGAARARSGRADIAPDVYHTDADPFQPADNSKPERQSASRLVAQHQDNDEDEGHDEHFSDASSIVASTFKAFMQSDTGKMLVAQASAVLIAYVAKKAGDYLPVLKNTDLAHPEHPHKEPETRDIEFTYHHDDADAPDQPA